MWRKIFKLTEKQKKMLIEANVLTKSQINTGEHEMLIKEKVSSKNQINNENNWGSPPSIKSNIGAHICNMIRKVDQKDLQYILNNLGSIVNEKFGSSKY